MICALSGVALILSVIALGGFGRDVVEYVYFPVAVMLILSSFGWDRLERPDLTFAAMALVPFAAFMLAHFIHTESYGQVRRVISDPYFWMEYGATSTLLVLGVLSARNLHKAARLALPLGLGALFVLLTVHKFDPTNPYGCRVQGYLGTPFMPALGYSSFALLYFALAPRLGRFAVVLSSLFLLGAVVVTLGYTAARGIFAGLLGSLLLISLALLLYRQGRWLLRLGVVVGSLGAGTVISGVIDIALNCNGVQRFQAIAQPDLDPSLEHNGLALIEARKEPLAPVAAPPADPAPEPPAEPAPEPAPEAPAETAPPPPPAPVEPAAEAAEAEPPATAEPYNAVTLRVLLWETALAQIAESPIIGSGRLAETARMLPSGHDHAHQQYFSWLIWFGLPGLIAGVLGLLAPSVALRWVASGQERLLILAATCGVLPLSLLFDSLLRLKQFIVFQLLFSAVAYVIVKELYREPDQSRSKPS